MTGPSLNELTDLVAPVIAEAALQERLLAVGEIKRFARRARTTDEVVAFCDLNERLVRALAEGRTS